MKKFFICLALLACSLTITNKSWGLVHVGASLAVSGAYDLKDSDGLKDQSFSGFGLSAVVPFGMMFRIDSLTAKAKVSGGGDLSADSTIYSIGYRFGFPLLPIHVAAAVGAGQAKINVGGATPSVKIKDVNQTQIYLEAGYAFIPLFDVFLGIHNISGGNLERDDGTKGDSKFSGNAYSLGLNFGF